MKDNSTLNQDVDSNSLSPHSLVMIQSDAGVIKDPPQIEAGPETTIVEEYARDETFYDDAIVFAVEGVNFRVSKILLERGSEVFKTMLSLPRGERTERDSKEGASDAHPISLPGVTADEFRDFLRVLYANPVETDNPTGITKIPSDWRPVLKLATLWEFDSIRKHAIHILRAEGPVDRIALSRMYDIKGWMEDALYALVHRDEPLTLDDFNALGLDLSIHIVQLRETVLKHPNRMLERPTEWLRCVGDVFGTDFVQCLRREWGTTHY